MMIRFFSVVAPGGAGDTGYAYLAELDRLGIATRALPIGPAAAIATERRWFELGHLFTTPMQIPFINVVCAPCDLAMGVRAPVATLAGGTQDLVKHERGGRDVMVFPDSMRAAIRETVGDKLVAHDVVYEPTSVFAGMWTAGVANVAIVTDEDPSPSASELVALDKYDFVLARSNADAVALAAEMPSRADRRRHILQGVLYVPPVAIAPYLDSLLEAICMSATSAPTIGSPATAAPHATTWLRSTRSASTSTSSSSATADRSPPSPATRTSIATRGSPNRSNSPGLLSRMWSWCTRHLWFWRR